jgi:dipeptide/tripeptide permease
MSKTREASTLAISLGSIAASLALISLMALVSRQSAFALGYFVAVLGLFYRESVVLRESKEGEMTKDKPSRIAPYRLNTSIIFRMLQVFPMIVWVVILQDNVVGFYLSVIFLGAAVVLALDEHFLLWH